MTDSSHDPAEAPDRRTATAPDLQSDPALDDGESSDWTSEGGATSGGPATASESSSE